MGAGAVVASVIALVLVHPWHGAEPSLKMAARPEAAKPVTADAPAAKPKSEPPPAVAPDSSPTFSTPPSPAKTAEAEPPKLAAEPAKPDPAPPKPAAEPQFDIVRVEPSGDALLAGRASPNATVALVDRGKVVDQAKADSSGSFVMTPSALKPGSYALSLRDGSAESKQSVTISVPKSKSDQVVVAMAEPGRPTTLLSPPPQGTPPQEARPAPAELSAPAPQASRPAVEPDTARPAAPPPASARPADTAAPAPRLVIRSVEVENGTGFYATGSAPPRADVRLYLNDARIADATASPAGTWSVTVRHGLAGGHYTVRADMVDSGGKVVARAEVPFDVPLPPTVAAAEPAPTPPAAPATPERAAENHAPTTATAEAVAPPPSAPPPSAPPSAATPPAATPRVEASRDPAPSPTAAAADVVLDSLQTELVTRGDNLWRISRHRLGQGTRYTQIYAANAAQIRNPRLIYPGQVFVLPRD